LCEKSARGGEGNRRAGQRSWKYKPGGVKGHGAGEGAALGKRRGPSPGGHSPRAKRPGSPRKALRLGAGPSPGGKPGTNGPVPWRSHRERSRSRAGKKSNNELRPEKARNDHAYQRVITILKQEAWAPPGVRRPPFHHPQVRPPASPVSMGTVSEAAERRGTDGRPSNQGGEKTHCRTASLSGPL